MESRKTLLRERIEAIIYKEGNKLNYKNCRLISLINTIYKMLSKLLLNTLKEKVEVIWDHQAGFIKGRSTMDQVFIIKEDKVKRTKYLSSKYWGYIKDFFIIL